MFSIYDYNFEDLVNVIIQAGQPEFRANQIWLGLYQNFYSNWEQFTNLPKELRNEFENKFSFGVIDSQKIIKSGNEGSQKSLFFTYEGFPVESVLLKSDNRHTLCISTQSGCAMGCVFCATGKLGLLRNLSSGEIIEQLIFFERTLNHQEKRINNIVIMGMGEPFTNYESVKNAIKIINHPEGINLGSRRITLSTIGIIPQILKFAQDFPQVNLSISLHAPNDELRTSLVPMNRYYPLSQLIKACREYINLTNRRITFEYVMIENVNDTKVHARQLISLLQNLLCHVNLIPLNPIDLAIIRPSPPQTIIAFQKLLVKQGVPTTIRKSFGLKINAGCGQLAGKL